MLCAILMATVYLLNKYSGMQKLFLAALLPLVEENDVAFISAADGEILDGSSGCEKGYGTPPNAAPRGI
jgi:hypothetical protein